MFLLTTKCSSILTMIITISLNAESEGRGSSAWLLSLANWETASCRPTLLALPGKTLWLYYSGSEFRYRFMLIGKRVFFTLINDIFILLWVCEDMVEDQAARWLDLVMTGRSANCTNNQQGLPLTWANLPPVAPGWWSKHIRKVDNFHLPRPGPHISATTKPGKEIRWQLICVDQEITADRQGRTRAKSPEEVLILLWELDGRDPHTISQ